MSEQKLSRRCWRRTDSKSPPLLKLVKEDLALPPPAGSVVIRVHTVSLNYRDGNIIHGLNPWPTTPNGIPCCDAVGEVVAVGPDVKSIKIGDRVSPIVDQESVTGREQERAWLAADVDGVLADFVVYDEGKVVKVPEHLTSAEAACLPCAGLTAWSALGGTETLGIGKSVLIQGTGGVSMMALKLARAAGCLVILSSSSDAKLDALKQKYNSPPLLTVNYRTQQNWHETVLDLTSGVGVDIVLENGGTGSIVKSIKCAKRGGIVSQVGYLGKQDPADLKNMLSVLIDRRTNLKYGISIRLRTEILTNRQGNQRRVKA